jgi:glucokinase
MKMGVLAVDLGGSHATCALVEDRTVLCMERLFFSDATNLAPLLPDLANVLRHLIGLSPTRITGIGFGFCALVDIKKNRVAATNGKFMDAPGLDLSRWADENFDIPLQLENDARLALRGECFAGSAQGETDVAMFTLGTGIGGVVMMDGKLLQGKHNQAGVLGGHLPVRLNGRRCSCGAIGCAESEASGWALPLVCREWPGFQQSALASCEINFENLFACAAAGDMLAQQIREHCLQVWAVTAVGAIHAFDPDLLLYGGRVMKSAAVILPFIEDYIGRHAWTPWGKVRVRAALLGDDAALLGAASLFQKEFQNV